MNIARTLLRSARMLPAHTAVYHGTEPHLDYSALAGRVARLAGGLRQRGLSEGDRVAIWMTNRPAYLETMYAIWWAGLVAVPINAKLHPKEAAHIVEDSGAAALVADEDHVAGLAPHASTDAPMIFTPGSPDYSTLLQAPPAALHARAPDDLAWLFYTSGTTGRPKGVMLTHRNLWAMAASYLVDVDNVDERDKSVYAAPMSHGAGLYSVVFMMQGAGHVFPASRGFDAGELFDIAQALPGVSLFAAPTMVNRLVRHAAENADDGAGFKTIVYGGGPMYAADIERAIEVMGPRFVQIYGQGEAPMTITVLARRLLMDREHPDWERRAASVGVSHAMVDVAVVDDAGQALPAGEPGEVIVRGDVVMAGYWRNSEATAKTLRNGWLWTGDIGAMDAHGMLTLMDRSKDVIISGGSNIYPREVEEVLLRAPGVAEVSVIGRPDPEWGEIVVAYVVCAPDTPLDTQALDAHCIEHIARFKRPKIYHAVAELPKNNYGKILKTELRALSADRK